MTQLFGTAKMLRDAMAGISKPASDKPRWANGEGVDVTDHWGDAMDPKGERGEYVKAFFGPRHQLRGVSVESNSGTRYIERNHCIGIFTISLIRELENQHEAESDAPAGRPTCAEDAMWA